MKKAVKKSNAPKAKQDKTPRLSTLKKGEIFRFKDKKTVYVYNGGGKVRGFNYYKWHDVNDHNSTKNDREVEIDFEF